MTSSECLEYDWRYLPIPFPKDMVFCELCPVMETYARRQCRSTGEYLISPCKHEYTEGWRCPLMTLEELISKEGNNGKIDISNAES
jgi:hypothetical protein